MRVVVIALAALAACSAPAFAQPEGARGAPPAAAGGKSSDADEKAIRENAKAFAKAFNSGDAAAVAAFWTPEGEFIDEEGTIISGRAAIEKDYTSFFKEHPKAHVQVAIDAIRFVGGALAFEEGTTRIIESPGGTTSNTRYTILYVKQDGKWLMASVRDLETASTSNYELLKELEPLVGQWTATQGDLRSEMSCEWIENRNFIRRRFNLYHGDELVGSGLEIIGVDPEIGEISSWQFTGEGGLGHNVWQWDGKRWVIDAKGTTRDGQPTAATNILTPLDKDTFNWQSVDRALGDQPVPDTAVAKIVRKKQTASAGGR